MNVIASVRSVRFPFAVLLTLLVALATAACDDDAVSPPEEQGREVGVVLNSIDLSLTLFPVDSPGVSRPPVGLGADGSPVGFALRGETAAVPMGFAPALAVVDLKAGAVVRSIALPPGSGATGSAFLNDSVVLVANPNLDTAVPVNVESGTLGDEVEVGGFPQGVAVAGSRVAVLNAELGPDFKPTGPATVTVLGRESLAVEGTVTLSGTNPGGAAVVGENLLFVVNSGSFGEGNGSLSLVDLSIPAEVGHWEDFGESPGAVAPGPDGLLYVTSFAYGLAIWDPATESFVRSPDDAVEPAGTPSVSDVAFDDAGRLHTVLPDCSAPGSVHRLDPLFSVTATWDAGTCPIDLAFVEIGG